MISQHMDSLKTLFQSNDMLWLLGSVIIGLAIGLEREYQNKSAGLRTFILISTGSCLFTILSIRIGVQNPDRLAANIITGIGFIGAGVIFKDDNKVTGITTAATIWTTASLGMCMGSGHLFLGFIGGATVLIILRGLMILQKWIDKIHKILVYTIVSNDATGISYCQTVFQQYDLKCEMVSQAYNQGNMITKWKITGNANNHQLMIEKLIADNRINSFQYI